MEREISKRDILNGNFDYPRGAITLIPTRHALERLQERGLGLTCLPTWVKVTEKNIWSGKTMDNKVLHSVVLRLDYSKREKMFVCLNPNDGGLKTVWFRDVHRKQKQHSTKSTERTI